MEEDLFQLRQLPVVKFRRTGESARSEDDTASGEHEVQIEGVRAGLEAVELDDGAAVPKEFANPTDDTFMVEDAVEAIGFGKFQWKLSVLTGLAWMADAMEMMILSILAPQLHCEWRLPSWQVALLTSVVFVGMMSSSTLWGNISDQYGRKTGLKISVLWTLYYGILSAFAPVYSWILVLRGLVGFGIGGVPQSVTLYAEFLPMKARAKCILLIEVFWAIGTVFEVILAVFVMPSLGWRWLLLLSAVPLLLFAVLCFWLPESARYDVLSGNQEKAIATLKRIATENGAPMPLGKLIISRQEDRGKMRDLFTPHFRWTTLLLWFIWFSNAFSYYGLVLLTTELFQAGDVCSSLPHGDPSAGPGHLQRHGKGGRSHHPVHCSGYAGIFRVLDAGGLQRLLPPGCPGLLLFAHRDQRPWTAGVQPPGVGPGDGRPRGTRHRCRQVKLRLSGIVTSGGAELVLEAVERGELVEPCWGTSRHCRHQELTLELHLDRRGFVS
uniref:Major facilitator superfamily (MFS) profile domain-containing protein n=1 Tax=Sus scrofa TaxID=9823 RepID=A0A8D1AX11_PIG